MKSYKNILLVTCWFPNADNPQFGSFILDHAMCLYKKELNVKILFIHIHKGDKLFRLNQDKYFVKNIPVLKIDITSKFWKFIYQWPLLIKKNILHLSNQPFITQSDIIHSHALFPAGFFGLQLAQKMAKPFILTEHWSMAASFLSKHPLRYYGRRVYQSADAIVFVSEYLKNIITKKIVLRNTHVIANPINSDLFFYTKKPNTPPIRFSMAAFWKKNGVKRGDLILKAFYEISKEKDLNFQLDIIGSGTALTLIKKWQQNTISQFVFTVLSIKKNWHYTYNKAIF